MSHAIAAWRRDEDQRVLERLRWQGARLAREFGLPDATIEAERDGIIAHYGICYEDGLIRIRLRHAVSGRLLKESSLVDTLCHELAHLRYLDHGLRFRGLYRMILDRARGLGYYRPRRVDDRPRQRSLFGGVGCRI